jgi:hypothetical protein
MKRLSIAAGLALLLHQAGVAQTPGKVAMVLKISGPVTQELAGIVDPVSTGQMWSQGSTIRVPAGSRLTVLLLQRGERLEIEGGGELKVNADGIKISGCKSRTLPSSQHKLALSGDNHRPIGGSTLRGDKLKDVSTSIDQVEVVGGDEPGIRLSQPALAGSPPKLKFTYFRYFSPISLSPQFEIVQQAFQDTSGESVWSTSLTAQQKGQRWQWLLPWPIEPAPQTYGLLVVNPTGSDKTPQLYTRVYHATAQEEAELTQIGKDVEAWVQREPNNSEPWVFYANLLEEKGHLQEALEAVDRALALQPRDAGLTQMKARVLLDLGRYQRAVQLLRQQAAP